MNAQHTKDQPCTCGMMCLLALQEVQDHQDAVTKLLGGHYEGQSIVEPWTPSPTDGSADNGIVSEL